MSSSEIIITQEALAIAMDDIDKRLLGCIKDHERVKSSTTLKHPQYCIDFGNTIIQLIKTEKLLYMSLGNPKSKKSIFLMILKKYDETLAELIELSSNGVSLDIIPEGEHIERCKKSLEQREYIIKLCDKGSLTSLE